MIVAIKCGRKMVRSIIVCVFNAFCVELFSIAKLSMESMHTLGHQETE